MERSAQSGSAWGNAPRSCTARFPGDTLRPAERQPVQHSKTVGLIRLLGWRGREKDITYVGSPEHKDTPSFAGPPRPRGDASICPREYRDEKLITRWLRAAICDGSTGAPWNGDFPRYVWHKENDTVFEARLVSRGNGTYKGYPLDDDEWPPHLLEGS